MPWKSSVLRRLMCESCCVLVLPSSLKLNIIRVGVKKASERKSWCRAFKSLCLSEKNIKQKKKSCYVKILPNWCSLLSCSIRPLMSACLPLLTDDIANTEKHTREQTWHQYLIKLFEPGSDWYLSQIQECCSLVTIDLIYNLHQFNFPEIFWCCCSYSHC